MFVLLKIIELLLVLFVIPIILGIPWIQADSLKHGYLCLLDIYLMGFFVMIALFEIIFFWGAVISVPFSTLSIIYSILLLLLVLGICIYLRKKAYFSIINDSLQVKWTKREWIYLGVFLGILFVQLFYAIFYSRTNMADDGYAAYSSSALSDNFIHMTNIYNGLYIVRDAAWFNRVIQSINYFPAYLSYITSIRPIIIDHTVIYALVVILAYSTYSILSIQMFDKREDRLLFLILVELLFIWGFHSHYSITFRLLGPNSEGKAILATVLAPYMLSIMYRVIEFGYQKKLGLQIFVLSVSACCLSLGGVYTIASILISMTIISAIKNKSFKVMLFLFWGGVVPVLLSSIYLYLRFRWG